MSLHAYRGVPENVRLLPIVVRCGCHRKAKRPFYITEEAVDFYKRNSAPPDLIVLSYRCPGGCHWIIPITARMLYLAA